MSKDTEPRARAARTLAGLALALGLSLFARAEAQSPPGGDIRHVTLENGMDVLLKPEPGHEAVSVQLWFQVGPRDESPETRGYAHLFEHLMFTGTDSLANFTGEIAALGGRSGSASWQDVTLFYNDVPSTGLDRVLAAEADRMRHLSLTETIIDATIEEVNNELTSMVQTTPNQFVEDRLRALAFAGHPYANPSLGATAGRSADRTDSYRAFYDRHYQPDRACLVIVGGFDPVATLSAVEELFGRLPAGQHQRAPVPAVPTPSLKRDALDLGRGVPVVAMAYPIPGESSADASAVRMLRAYLLGPARQSWVDRLNGDDGNLVAQTDVDLLVDMAAGLFVVNVTLLDRSDAQAVEERCLAFLDELAPSIRQSASELDIDSLREALVYHTLTTRRHASTRASALATAHLLSGDYRSYATEREQLAAVDPTALARIAESLTSERALVVTLGMSFQ